MHTLEPQIRELESEGSDAAAITLPLALESRSVFSVHRELLFALYGSVAAIVAGVGLLVKNNFDRIGPITLLATLLAGAGLCYFITARAQLREQARSLAGDYVLLLGALLLSAALGYAEIRFHWLGVSWSRHLLLLAAIHLITAYAFDSRLVLSVALGSFAGWLGVDAQLSNLWDLQYSLRSLGCRSLICAAVYLAGREIHRRVRSSRNFLEVYEHFAVNFAFWGLLSLSFAVDTRWVGLALLLALALCVGRIGLRKSRELFVLYAIGYAAFGLCSVESQLLRDELLTAVAWLVTLVVAIALLWRLRAQMRERAL
jgi:hypothetical protein